MVGALIFDMDGTMIDSMPWHQKSWVTFCERRGLDIDVPDLMRRTTGRTGIECMVELFGGIPHEQAQAFVDEKEGIYRELFAPSFSEIAGFKAFLGHAQSRGLAVGVGTAGDRHNQAFAYRHLSLGQTHRLEAIERSYAVERKRLEGDVRAANRELAAAIQKGHKDSPELEAAIDHLHMAMGALQKATISHVFDMRAVLTPQQAKAFDAEIVSALTEEER